MNGTISTFPWNSIQIKHLNTTTPLHRRTPENSKVHIKYQCLPRAVFFSLSLSDNHVGFNNNGNTSDEFLKDIPML